LIRPCSAAARSAADASPDTFGGDSRPTTVISSRSIVISIGSVNHSPGIRPANQPRMRSSRSCDVFMPG
jgi:hypothetical protein